MQRRRSYALLAVAALMFVSFGRHFSGGAALAGGRTVLIYGPSLNGFPENEQTVAERYGYTVTVADEAMWSSLNMDDFASYDAIVFGDPTCLYNDPSVLDTAVANRATWSPAVTGSILVMATDPVYHQAEGDALKLIRNGLSFAAHMGTGLYADLSCYYASAEPGTQVELLTEFGTFEVRRQGGACSEIQIRPGAESHPVLRTISDAGLTWGCAVHGRFASYPSDFTALVEDELSSRPYILATRPDRST